MNLKALFLSTAVLAIATNSRAQDKIYKKNGDVIDGKVKSVNERTIIFKRSDNAKGPDYTISKNELEKVEYENGTEDMFEQRGRRSSRNDEDDDMDDREIRHNDRDHGREHGEKRKKQKIKYGDNLVTFAPANVTENGFGIGMSYEHAFGKKGIVALYFPVSVSFGDVNGDPSYPGYNSGNGTFSRTYTNVSFMIGPKIYPTGCRGKVRYALAPVLTLVTGQRPAESMDNYYYAYYNNYNYPYYNGNYYNGNVENFQFGGMLINSLNMNPSKHLYIGLELGWGFTWINRLANIDQNTRMTAQFAFRLGYRF
ncbi:MAG: hypothetical protein JSS82_10190 [Bacteroidetes bacterium]|nr:hypothetical protein [Bacteroidota bacterium]